MTPVSRPIPITPYQSFAVKHLRGTDCNIPYHVHDAHELILIRSGSGIFYVGNAVRKFQPGDVFLLAPGVPHWFKCERLVVGSNTDEDEFIVLQFYKSFLGDTYFDLPEHWKLKRLFTTDGLALAFADTTQDSLAEFLLSMPHAIGQGRLLLVLRLLAVLGDNPNCIPLHYAISTGIDLQGQEPLERIRAYITGRIHDRIYLEETAELVNMSVPTFCRYFKQRTGKTLTGFIQELRVERACELLKDTSLSIRKVSKDSGFQSMAHFIRLLKRLKGMTPQEFRASFRSSVVVALVVSIVGCMPTTNRQEDRVARMYRKEPIKKLAGDVDVTPTVGALDSGRVLMSYSDCFTCHKETDRKRGPAFTDIAARYPMNSTYIQVLAKRIILGAKGSWGNVVMPPHPTVSQEDAENAVMYILSLDGSN